MANQANGDSNPERVHIEMSGDVPLEVAAELGRIAREASIQFEVVPTTQHIMSESDLEAYAAQLIAAGGLPSGTQIAARVWSAIRRSPRVSALDLPAEPRPTRYVVGQQVIFESVEHLTQAVEQRVGAMKRPNYGSVMQEVFGVDSPNLFGEAAYHFLNGFVQDRRAQYDQSEQQA